jgi:hypothetical protein
MDKYRVYCETEGVWHEVIATSEPTVCPVDSGHTLRAGSACVVDTNVEIHEAGVYVELTIDEHKVLKSREIDGRTGELISLGFAYATKQFSLSQNAQINISALNQTRDELTYPINYNTVDDLDTYDVVDATDMHNMYLTALSTKKAHLDSGTALKNQVRAATTHNEIDAVIDNR